MGLVMEDPEGRDYVAPEFKPEILLLISGKRKCGKDYFTDLLLKQLNSKENPNNTAVMRIAEPIKYYWAQKHELDFNKLLDTSAYEEQHRYEMVKWSMEVRAVNKGYFNVQAITMADGIGKPVWICVDIRHKRDYFWFLENYEDRIKRVRITADQSVRNERGWKFTEGVDDGPSECDLDDVIDWDLIIENNGTNPEGVENGLGIVKQWINSAIKNHS